MFGRRRNPAADAAAFLNGTKVMVFGDVLIDNFLPDDLDTYGEWAKELHAWSCTSAAFLLFFGALSSEPFKVSLIPSIMSKMKVAKNWHQLHYHVQNVMM